MVAVGTWIWLASDLMFFAALFAAYFNLRSITNAAAAEAGTQSLWEWGTAHFNMPFAVTNTLILILSSVTCQMGVWKAERGQVGRTGSLLQVGQWGLREWYILTFVIIYAVAYLTDALAPTFGGEKHLPSALKLIAYSYTPLWVASIFSFVPLIGFLIVLAGLVYTIYVLYLGVPVMMRAPQDKTVGYTIVIIIGGIITGLVINYIAWALARIVA